MGQNSLGGGDTFRHFTHSMPIGARAHFRNSSNTWSFFSSFYFFPYMDLGGGGLRLKDKSPKILVHLFDALPYMLIGHLTHTLIIKDII